MTVPSPVDCIERTDHPLYPWRVKRDFFFHVKGIPVELDLKLKGKDGKTYAHLHWSHINMMEGYQFDGCTCAPDFKRALPGCCVHDALLQMLKENPEAFPESVAHKTMLEIHRSSCFSLRKLYYYAVAGWPRKLYNLTTTLIKKP